MGRQAELALLLDRLSAVPDGHGGVLLVSGPAGIGKTRLVEEALARYGGVVGRGVCTAWAGSPPTAAPTSATSWPSSDWPTGPS